MGWAGPAQLTGPDSAPKLVGRFRPKMDWADLGPKKTLLGQIRPRRQGWSGPPDWAGLSPKFLDRFRPKMGWADLGPKTKKHIIFWARPGPEDRAGPGSAWPKPKRGGGGIIFPPPLHAERYSFCMQGKKRENKREGEGEEKLPGAEAEAVAGYVSGGAVVEAGSGVAAPWRRLQAAALLSQAAERGLLPLSFTSVSFPFLLLLWFSFPLFSLLSVFFFLSPFSLFRFFRSPLSLLCFFVFSFFSPSVLFSPFFPLFFFSFSQRSWPLFIEAKDAVFYSSHGEQPVGRPLGAAAEVRWVARGGWSAIVSGRWAPGERMAGKIQKKNFPFSFFPAA